MNHEVFISYSSRDREAAQIICSALEQNDVKCWIAPRDIPAGAEYGDLIDEAIRRSVAAIVIFSETAASSVWVKAEMNVAFDEQKIIIPFRLDQTPLQGQSRLILNHKHWIDAYPDYKLKIDDLVVAVLRALGKSVVNETEESSVSPIQVEDIDVKSVLVSPENKRARATESRPASAKPSRSGKKWAIALIAVLALLLVGAGAGYLYQKLSDKATTEEVGVEPVGKYPFTSQRLITEKDVKGLSISELRIMRNEIYARHGHIFKDAEMRSYFEAQKWYKPRPTSVKLSAIERKNILLIQQYENL